MRDKRERKKKPNTESTSSNLGRTDTLTTRVENKLNELRSLRELKAYCCFGLPLARIQHHSVRTLYAFRRFNFCVAVYVRRR